MKQVFCDCIIIECIKLVVPKEGRYGRYYSKTSYTNQNVRGKLELVKKLDKSERKVLEKQESYQKNKLFELIKKVIIEGKLEKMTTYLCELGGGSTSGYYAYWKNEGKRYIQDSRDAEDFAKIKEAYNFKEYTKEVRSIQMTLKSDFGIHFNCKKIQRLMRKFKMSVKLGELIHIRMWQKQQKNVQLS